MWIGKIIAQSQYVRLKVLEVLNMTRMRVPLDPTKTGKEAETLESNLKRLIIGQDDAIQQIVNMYQMHQTGLNAPGRPIANFLFLGPTGSGKTRIVEATAESLLGTPRALLKIDCAEFQHSHEIAKLIGSPPGYLGHRETHPLLSQEVINQYQNDRVRLSFILFDEIEKASDSLWNLLLGILDKATLTLGDNRKVDFSRAMIFMTSNLGAAEMSSILSPKMGFFANGTGRTKISPTEEQESELASKIGRSAIEAARRKFTPEFINRLDKIVVFKPLGVRELRRVLDIELTLLQQRVFGSTAEKPFVFTVTDQGKGFLLQEGTDAKYGARHLKRAIERHLVQPISNLIATEQVQTGDWIRIDYAPKSGLTFLKEAEGLPINKMAELAGSPTTDVSMPAAAVITAEAGRTVSARSSRRT